MTSSKDRIQQLLTDVKTLKAENKVLKTFAEAMFEYFQPDEIDLTGQCGYCLWSERGPGTHECALETYGASRGDE